jgi:hypothetical protein
LQFVRDKSFCRPHNRPEIDETGEGRRPSPPGSVDGCVVEVILIEVRRKPHKCLNGLYHREWLPFEKIEAVKKQILSKGPSIIFHSLNYVVPNCIHPHVAIPQGRFPTFQKGIERRNICSPERPVSVTGNGAFGRVTQAHNYLNVVREGANPLTGFAVVEINGAYVKANLVLPHSLKQAKIPVMSPSVVHGKKSDLLIERPCPFVGCHIA